MRTSTSHIVCRTVCGWLLAAAGLSGCAHATDGRAVHATTSSAAATHLVTVAELPKFYPALTELGAAMDAPQLHQDDTYTGITPLPEGRFLSDPNCASIMSPGLDTTYRGSQDQGAYGIDASDDQGHTIQPIIVVFPGTTEAQGFVGLQLEKWRSCSNRMLSFGADNRPPLNTMVGAVSTSGGVDTILRVQEGGHDFACGRGVAAAGNVVADLMLCNFNDDVVKRQVGAVVNLMLSKLPK